MPKGPQGQKRPADLIGCAVTVMRIATGDEEEVLAAPSGKVRSGKAGGSARAAKLDSATKSEIARRAAMRRWE
jgi:hypothetical protein